MVGLLELLVVIGIFCLDLIGLIDQKKTNHLQRGYWQERTDYFARKLRQPPKPKEQKAPEVNPQEPKAC